MSRTRARELRCCYHGLTFDNTTTLIQHIEAQHPSCKGCSQEFWSDDELLAHQKKSCHWFCQECDKCFQTLKLQTLHVRGSPHKEHFKCCDCNREYANQDSLNTHCCICDRVFFSRSDLNQHVAQSPRHQRLQKTKKQYGCTVCGRQFAEQSALRMHEQALNHNAGHEIACPVNAKCSKKFATSSACLNHLESGSCKSGMTRQKLHELVALHDKDHQITHKNATDVVNTVSANVQMASTGQLALSKSALKRHEQFTKSKDNLPKPDDSDTSSNTTRTSFLEVADENSMSHSHLLVPDEDKTSEWSRVSAPSVLSLESTSCSEAGGIALSTMSNVASKAQCTVCLKTFGSTAALQMHLSSPVHGLKIFHCPISLVPKRSTARAQKGEKSFATLGGLALHLESGSCRGGLATFKKAVCFLQQRLADLNVGHFKLLTEVDRPMN